MPLVPDDFDVPERLEGEGFILRPLSVHDVIKDFDAVMASKDKLTSPNEANSGWPHNLTIMQNLIDLAWHHKEFQNRTSFAFTVIRPDESEIIGCLYIYPTDKKAHDAKIEFWCRDDSGITDLDDRLNDLIRGWISSSWPFQNPAYPGRDMSYEEWGKL